VKLLSSSTSEEAINYFDKVLAVEPNNTITSNLLMLIEISKDPPFAMLLVSAIFLFGYAYYLLPLFNLVCSPSFSTNVSCISWFIITWHNRLPLAF
jgi:hypothetical protein